ncbi:MAG TPA: type II toxin-antitoxin system PemK/MazF family toxin [Bryobacteraceae bacterium]|jgi:mRNA interferase MazF
MRRGEIWTVAGGPYYAGKPRPVVIVQADWYTGFDSVTVCPFTSDNTHAPSVRIPVNPTENNGLRSPSWLMPDKLVTVPVVSTPEPRLGSRTGRLDFPECTGRSLAVVRDSRSRATLAELSRNIISFLNLAVRASSQHPAAPTTSRR